MPRKIVIPLLAVFLLTINIVGAQEGDEPDNPFTPQTRTNERSLGDQTFAISLGILGPLSTVLLGGPAGYTSGITDSHLSVGGVGSLTYSTYLSPNIKVGLQLAGSFTKEINDNWLYMIPVTVKGSYEFHPWNRITIPLHLALGINMSSWKQNFTVDPIIRPGFGVYFDWSTEWSFGADMTYWFVPQLSADDNEYDAIGNFLDATLTAEYHF